MDAVELEIFRHLFASVAEEMGVRLIRSAFSPNIKERRDLSCALFDGHAQMIAQAAHIPVHLGSTPMSVQAAVNAMGGDSFCPDDLIVLNDPFFGGTHLPDITLVAPCFLYGEPGGSPRFFVANRAHHADVGGITPGSMPLSTKIDQEGIRIPPTRLDDQVIEQICSASRTPDERLGDLRAQVAAARLGVERLAHMCNRYGVEVVCARAAELQDYAERMMRGVISGIPNGTWAFEDVLDDDGAGTFDIPLRCALTVHGDELLVDFAGTSPQVLGSMNAVRAITVSAVGYAVRCLGPEEMPNNAGTMRPVTVRTTPGSVVDALPPAAVAAGNVETSQRIVDVVLGALAQAIPDRIPAASCGSMNNVSVGGTDPRLGREFAYYETLAGGAGGGPTRPGESAVHTHMTNTLNTPVEALEHSCPLRVESYRIRGGSGGDGLHAGGEGLVRSYVFEAPSRVTLITERRRNAPYGLRGGGAGHCGRNVLRAANETTELPAKVTMDVEPGDCLEVHTPGGGGWREA